MADHVVTVAHSVPASVAEWIATEAKRRGVSKSKVVSDALASVKDDQPTLTDLVDENGGDLEGALDALMQVAS